MRGAHVKTRGKPLFSGIIPADAGSTTATQYGRTGWQDHPRGCGKHFIDRGPCVHIDGSSPRMRGAHGSVLGYPDARGIIPADAGSTYSPASPCPKEGDHPRGCGEHHVHPHHVRLVDGSSPRMRGAHHMVQVAQKAKGSSPRMRGALSDRPSRCQQTRIIPADAGSTRRPPSGPAWGRDHPRGCGEHAVLAVLVAAVIGSSPRMRGAPGIIHRRGEKLGIIPADAGSTI